MSLTLSVQDYPLAAKATLSWVGDSTPPYTVHFSHSPNMTDIYLVWPVNTGGSYQPVTYKHDGVPRYARVHGQGINEQISNVVGFGKPVPTPTPVPPVPQPTKIHQIDVYSNGTIAIDGGMVQSLPDADVWIPGVNGRRVVATGRMGEAWAWDETLPV